MDFAINLSRGVMTSGEHLATSLPLDLQAVWETMYVVGCGVWEDVG